MSEKNALGRVLMAARAAYAYLAKGEGEIEGAADILDSLSAALSHAGNAQRPLSGLMRQVKRELKAAEKPLWAQLRRSFSPLNPVMNYAYDKALKHIPAFIYGNDMIVNKIYAGETDKACTMAEAMKSYPAFIFGEFEAMSDEQFFDLVFGYYPKQYGEPFMEEMRGLFDGKL